MYLLLRWVISAAAVWAAVRLVPGIQIEEGLAPLLLVAFVLGGVNALVRPLLRWLACGLIFVTLGLFLLVINAAMLLLAGWITRSLGVAFQVDGFLSALAGSVVISVVSYVASVLFLPDRSDD